MMAYLIQQMDNDWGQIYLYIAGKTYARWEKADIPGDIRVDSLRSDQVAELNRLQGWLYKKRCQIRLDSERVERGIGNRKRQLEERQSSRHYLPSNKLLLVYY